MMIVFTASVMRNLNKTINRANEVDKICNLTIQISILNVK